MPTQIRHIVTTDQKLAALKFLESRILRSDGQAYEDLFCEVMVAANPNFKTVKPHGRIGDRKNDGFDSVVGLFCQVFAPENLHKSEGSALKKLAEDFAGLLAHWPHIAPIKEFWFVLNDRYKGTTHPIEDLLSKLSETHNIPCRSFLNKDLEHVFESLPEEKKLRVVGSLPNPETLAAFEFSSLNEIIVHLMEIKVVAQRETRPENLDFIQKIQFNNLSDYPGSLLRAGDYQRAEIETYFSGRLNASKLDIQQRFIELYKEGQQHWQDSEGAADSIFWHILDSAKPSKEAKYDSEVAALMAFYFEKCDIFEEPTTNRT